MIVNGDTLRRTFDVYEQRMPLDTDLVEPVRHRARVDRRKRFATVAGVLCALFVVGGTWFLETRTSASGDVASEPPGKAVGERLGLEPLAFPGEGCEQYAGYEHDWGYCLDGVTDNETELVLLSQEIYGYEMTDARVAYVTAMSELSSYSRSEADEERTTIEELHAILDETRAELEPLYEPTDISTFAGLRGEAFAEAANLVPSRGIPFIGGGGLPSFIVEVGSVVYSLDGLATTDEEAEEWASRLGSRDVRQEVVPDVVGLPEDEAVEALEAAGFAVKIDRAYNEDIPEGVVSYQMGRAGERALLLTPQEIVVSKGAIPTTPPASTPAIEMPDLLGLTTREAEEVTRRLGLYGPFMKSTVGGNPDIVIRQQPAAGTDVYAASGEFPGTVVHLWIGYAN